MFKNVVLLGFKLVMTTAHGHMWSVLMMYGQMMMIQNHEICGSSRTFGHRSHPQHPRRSALPHAWSKLPLRSTLALMPRVRPWQLGMRIHCDASHTDRVKSRAFIMRFAAHVTHVKTGEKELHGSAGNRQAERGGQRSAMLVRVADRVLVLT